MNHNNLLQGYNWDAPYDDSQNQNSRQRDEVISVYEIYVKDEETVGPDGKIDSSIISGLGTSGNQLIQSDCVIELDETLETELIRPDITVERLCSNKDAIKYKIIDRNNDEKFLPYSQSLTSHVQTPAATELVDKDDPRSRLHFVKYLKREGKTLKIWECGICSKEFRHQYTLMRHLPTHTDERNFKCETCGKAFRQLSTLSQHRAIHSDARPYVCEYCKKTFNRVSTLISHRKTHSDDKPHKCQICGKGFHQKGNLRNHVFTHTNERPYKCPLCGKGFNQMSNLMCHKLKSHAHVAKSLPYACSICGKEFLRRFALRSHEEHKHGIKYSQPKTNAVLDDGVTPKNSDVRIPNSEIHPRTPQVASISSSISGFVSTDGRNSDSLIIDAIQTKAMEDAVILGQTPFALFKPINGIPILVKVSPNSLNDGKQILSPATPEDLKLAGKMCLSPVNLANDPDGLKTVQIKVPVVATVTQTIDAVGNFKFVVEPPEPDQDQESHVIETQFCYPELGDDKNENPNTDGRRNRLCTSNEVGVGKESTDDLLTLATEGGDVRYIRATEDGRYEMMTNSEAIDLMAQNCHDVTVLNDVDVASMSFDDHLAIDSGNREKNFTSNSQKNIEVFGDKDFRILGSREDRFTVDDISLLEQSKIDDFILGSRNGNSDIVVNDDGCSFSSVIDSSSSFVRNHALDPNEFQIFNNRRFYH